MMDALQIETDEPLEVPNIVHSSNDLHVPKSNSCSTFQVLVGSFTLKEEDIADPLQIKNDELMKYSNFSQSSYGLDNPKSSSCNSSHALVGSFTLNEEEITDPLLIKNEEPTKLANFSQSSYDLDNPKNSSCNSSHALVGSLTLNEEEKVDPLTIKNDEPMKVSNFSRSSYGLDTPKSSYCNSSQALVGSFTIKEKGSFCNVPSQKKRIGLFKDLSSTGETVWLASVSRQSKQCEKIYLKTTVEIEKLTKHTIEENCCGKWRCSACGKIENSFYFLQLHKSTNCETGLSFICEICCKEINNYSDFAIHYIEHEADKKKKCPVCLCPNVNDIKKHVIVKRHLSEDIIGLESAENEFKRSNQKAKPEVSSRSTIDGYCQDFNVDSLSKRSEKKVKKEYLSMVESTPDVQEKPNLRKRKENAIYVESSDSDMDDISDEEMDTYSEEAYEVTSSDEYDPRKMSPENYIGQVKAKNHASGKEPSQLEKVALESFGSRWKGMLLRVEKKSSIESSENTHICKICNESFSLRISLSNHMKGHDEIEIQQCQFYCSKFKKRPNLDCCFETQNGTRDSSYECTICEKTFTIDKSFTYHMRWHSQALRATALNGKSASDLVFLNHLDFTNDNSNERAISRKTSKLRERFSIKDKPSKLIEAVHLYKCDSCEKTFKDRKYFLRHIRIEHKLTETDNEDEMHQCPFCQTKFKKKYHLYRHLMTHRNGSELRCNKCPESFPWPFELVTHLEMHKKIETVSDVQPLKNSDAEPTSNSEPVTNNVVAESNFNECGICKKTYVKRISLLRHVRRHVEGRKYLCYICGLGFFSEKDLKTHIQRHTGDKNFMCDKCGKGFYSMSLLNQHLKKHTAEESGQIPEKVFGCEMCNTKFETKIGYSLHMKKHNEGATHECGFCQRKFYTSYRLTEHMRTHTGEKLYKCKICNNSFAQKQGLNSHMNSHSDKRPYSCELCAKTFKNKNSKNDHVNTHTGNRPYKCKQCDMCFGARKNLKNHIKVHTRNPEQKKFREKKYSCNICSEVFAVSAYRDQHVALHANPNPFSCEFCSKNFNYKKNMVAHVQRVHPSSNPFRCKLCNKTYDSIRKLDVHINSRACVKKDNFQKTPKNQGKSVELDGNTNSENLFMCNICNEEFLSVEKIQDHFNSSHKPSK